jgi:hypothetical protein
MKPLTPADDKEIFRLYQEDPNILGISRKLSRHPITIRKSLLRQGVQLGTNEAIADVLIERLKKLPAVTQQNFDQLARAVGSSDVVGVLRNPEKYREAVISNTKAGLLLKIAAMNEEERLKGASMNALSQAVINDARLLSGEFKLSEKEKEAINSEKIIESISFCLKKIRIFNPKLAQETEEVVDGIKNMPKSAYKKLSKQNGGNDGHSDTVQNRQ